MRQYYIYRHRWIVVFLLMLFIYTCCVSKSRFGVADKIACPPPAIYNLEKLNDLRTDRLKTKKETSRFLRDADAIIKDKPVSIMEKKKSFSSDYHNYCSISRYAWPSEKNPEIYVIRDGETNPEWEHYDAKKLDILCSRIKTLGTAYYITRDKKYYDAFCIQLKIWFLAPTTYMKPNLEYSGVQPGKNENKGMAYGLVSLNRFTPIIESILLVQSVNKLDNELLHGLEMWFADMLAWTLKSKQWESQGNNNIITSLYTALVEMAIFTGDNATINKLAGEYKERILDIQIDDDGKQPAELKRTIGFDYSVSNLNNIIDFCLIMEQAGIHFYSDNQKKIDSAFEYLMQFVGNHEAFPYQQIQGWDGYEKKLMRNISRLSRLKSNKGRRFGNTSQSKFEVNDVLNYVY